MFAATTGNIVAALIGVSGAVVLCLLGGLVSIKTDLAALKQAVIDLNNRVDRLEDKRG